MTPEIEILKRELLNESFNQVTIGCGFDLHFSKCYLTAHECRTSSEEVITDAIKNVYPEMRLSSDPNDIARSAVLSSLIGIEVTDIKVDEDNSLILSFATGIHIKFPTDSDIVDWQWALTRDKNDPYLDCIIGVFDDRSIQINRAPE